MADLDLLKNDGVLALNPPAAPAAEKTVVVLGAARGGTTMVASVLDALGVPMGENLGPVLEDVALSRAVESRDLGTLQKIIASRNEQYPVWGWKRPAALEYEDVWRGRFRNPYLIAIFRDPFAIANRNRISMLSDVFQNMEQSVRHLGALVAIMKKHKGPALLCSYEKALGSPAVFVRAVDDFLGLNVADRHAEAIGRISPNSPEYLKRSRITNSRGHLDVANEQLCSGWAYYSKVPKRVAKVHILVNDRQVCEVEARFPRPEIKERGLHPTGFCGFRVEWPAGEAPRPGDRVEARVEGDIGPLKGSPRVVRAVARPVPRRLGAHAASGGALPSFYGIGAQKAGTTWLYEMLKSHPEVHIPQAKEMHYWDRNSPLPLDWYRSHFAPGRINGDITPSYAILPETKISAIHAANPGARLLFSMRHPVERAWSFVKMAIGRKFKDVPADLAAGEPGGEALAFVRDQLFHPGCLARNNYARTIRRWRGTFGDDALMLYRYERIAREPRALLSEICRHIGADAAWAEDVAAERIEGTVFASVDIPFPPALRAEYAERCQPYIDDLEALLGERFDDWRS